MTVNWQQLAADVETARQARGLSLREVGRQTGVASSGLVKLRQGGKLSADTVASLAAWLNPSTSDDETLADTIALCTGTDPAAAVEGALRYVTGRVEHWTRETLDDGITMIYTENNAHRVRRAADELRRYLAAARQQGPESNQDDDIVDRWNRHTRHLPPGNDEAAHAIVVAGIAVSAYIDRDDTGTPELAISIDAHHASPELVALTQKNLGVSVSTRQPNDRHDFHGADQPLFRIDLAQPHTPQAGDAREILSEVCGELQKLGIDTSREDVAQHNTTCADARLPRHGLHLRIWTRFEPCWHLGTNDEQVINRPLTDTPELIAHITLNAIKSRVAVAAPPPAAPTPEAPQPQAVQAEPQQAPPARPPSGQGEPQSTAPEPPPGQPPGTPAQAAP